MSNLNAHKISETTDRLIIATYGTPLFLSHFTSALGARLSSAITKKPLAPDAR